MKKLNRYNLLIVAMLMAISGFSSEGNSLTELTKNYVEEFSANEDTQVALRHRRGDLTVKYVQGDMGKVEVDITVKGEDENDIQEILDALSIEIAKQGDNVEIETANKIISWSNSIGLFGSKHKLILKNGKTITTRIDDIDIKAVLYLPRVNSIALNTRYDDVRIEGYKSDRLIIDAHSGKVMAGDLLSDTHIKIKYGSLDIKNVEKLMLDSHDSKGSAGNIGALNLKDKYSDLTFGNLKSLIADIHDAEIVFGAVEGNAQLKDKYSVLTMDDIGDGNWDLHDSKIKVSNANSIKVNTKYSDIVVQNVQKMDVDCHDDEFDVAAIEELNITHSKYSKFNIERLGKYLNASNSHDDKFTVDKVKGSMFKGFMLYAKYTEMDLPLPSGLSFSIEAKMKYGSLEYPKEGIKEITHIKDGSDLEVKAKAADGSDRIVIKIEGHDCKVDLNS